MKYAPEIAFALGMSVLISYVVSCDHGSRGGARIVAAKLQVDVFVKYLESSKRKYGHYPTELETPDDPWGSPYSVNAPRVCSLGPDRHPGTPDDICAP